MAAHQPRMEARVKRYRYIKLQPNARLPRPSEMRPGQNDMMSKTHIFESHGNGQRLHWLEREGDTLTISNATRTIAIEFPWSSVAHGVLEAAEGKAGK